MVGEHAAGTTGMRLREPRIKPLADDELNAMEREALAPFAGRPILNIFRTLVRAPEAFKRFNEWGGYILSKRSSLPPRGREILILRAGWLCRSGYEFAQHKRIGLKAGLSADEVERIKKGADAGWLPAEAVLIRAADDLVRDYFISEEVWNDLTSLYNERACMDVVFTVGQYTQVSMMLNSFGVQLEPNESLDPDLDFRA